MLIALTGPNQGKTMKLGGFIFRNGVTEVPDDAKDAHKLLRQFYAAHPTHLLEKDSDGKLKVKAEEPQQQDPTINEPFSDPFVVPQQPQQQGVQELNTSGAQLDEAGGISGPGTAATGKPGKKARE